MSEQPPGSFREADSLEPDPFQPPAGEVQERTLERSPRLVDCYRTFSRECAPGTAMVLYPSSATDASASEVFPNVTYVDIDAAAIAALQGAGHAAHCMRIQDFTPEREVDVLILLNPAGAGTHAARHVAVWGHVLCNDYHRTATTIREHGDFGLLGILVKEDAEFDRDHPELYWKDVETDAEFERASAYVYEVARRVVADVQGIVTGDVVGAYAQIYRDAPESAGIRMHGDEYLPALPRKKGHMDDLFVFRRVRKQSDADANSATA